MTNNLLIEETLDELIQGMELDKFTLQILQKLSYIHRNRKAISFKICNTKLWLELLQKASIEALNK
jgi:hypothetical protein